MSGPGDWPLIGREAELGAIAAVLGSPAPGLVLVGEAGVGKTRLLRTVLAQAAASGHACEWVSATAAVASIPFGAVAHLMPAGLPSQRDPVSLFAAVEQELANRRAGRAMVVGIDDAHLLDETSAGLLHQLALRGSIKALATVRAGAPVSDALTSLWTNDGARIEVRPLPPSAVDDLLDRSVPGPIDAISRQRLVRLAAGNPLLLREMLADAIESGTLHAQQGIWRWRGTGGASPRLRELVGSRLRALEPATRQALEIIACGEPVSLGELERLADPSALEAAERSGMAVAERSGSRVALRLTHPLYGEALRAGMPATRARTVFTQLADMVAAGPMRRANDALAVGVWQLQSGVIKHPAIMLAAARQAIDRFDIDLAEKLVRAARSAESGWDADWLLARVLQYQARSQEAFDVLPPAPPAMSKQLAIWAVTRAGLLYWGLDRTEEALDTLAQVPAGSPGQDLVEATRSWIQFYDGRCEEALDVALAVLARPQVSVRAAIWATMSAASAAGMLGRIDLATELAERGRAMAEGDGSGWAHAQVGWGLCYALRGAGRLADAAAVADDGYRRAIADDARGMAGVWAGFRGVVARGRGLVGEADTCLREAIALLEENDQYRLVPTFQAELAGVLALAGDLDGAVARLDAADAGRGAANRLFHPWIELDRAWVLAARGDLAAAARTARSAGDLAHDSGQPTLEAVALYDTVRLGDPAADVARLADLGERLGGAAAAYATAAEALGRDDGAALERVAETFAHLGLAVLAAEAATAAARAFHAAGLPRRRLAAAARAAALLQSCPGVRTPLLAQGTGEQSPLTPREHDVAVLATSLGSREIAERLGLSVNTVNNNLARVFAKLGVRNRRELANVLGAAAGRRPRDSTA